MSLRVLFHVQHLLGTGHQHRSAAIARTLADDDGLQVHYVSGGMSVPGLDTGACHVHALPAAQALDARFSALADVEGRRVDARWQAHRRDRLLALVERVRPHVIVTETFPFGRGLLRFELLPMVECAHRLGAALVCSVRDIVEPRDRPGKLEAMARVARSHYRAVLVHGDPALIPFGRTFTPWRDIEDLLRYTGYVCARAPAPAPARDGPVLVSCGGGKVGGALLAAASRARRWCRATTRPWELRMGTAAEIPEALRVGAAPGTRWSLNRPDFIGDLARAEVSVSQAGYGTVAEILATRTPAVLVPYDGEQEQGIRAAALLEAGHAQVLAASTLTPEGLAAAVDAAVGAGAPAVSVRLDGVRFSVQHIRALAAETARTGPGSRSG